MEAETRTPWYGAYTGKVVGFVVHTRHDKFLPLIGNCLEIEEDDDCLINVLAKNEPQDTLEAALVLLDGIEKDHLHHIFRRPVKGSSMGTWLVQLVREETGGNPRERAAPPLQASP